MKTKITFSLFLLLALVLSACGAEAAATPAEEVSLDTVYTSVAMTLAAQPAEATSTLQPSATSTNAPIATLISLPTSTSFASLVSLSSGSTSCDNSIYISDVTIPDGTVITPGTTFTKTWSMQNAGTCTWSTSYSIVFYSGNAMSGVTTALSESVSPGGSISISVELTAPSTTGSYTGYWRLQNASGTSFGEAVYVQIVVSGSTATPTSTPTATSETNSYTSTPTTTPTATTAPTSTTMPTNTLEPTATTAPNP